ncbi:hypothetical protein E8E12_000665 [Didymella heteroderae]|uniref:Uncharacterized protein n=1 Tax=Didymella heteroderae TaxID=1769908 RepID=A0A9P4WFK7_9PLEO|nr:hypothetical protein E8E12_000665 [Didymella heteroderae]
MSEDIKDYWVQQLFRLDTDLDSRWSENVCLARLLAEKIAQLRIPLSLKDVHADLGYKFKCTTCFSEPTAKAGVLVSLDFAVTHLGLPLGGPVPALWASIRDALRISCRNLNLDAHGALLTEAGLKRSNNSCDSFDSYCFNATLFAQNGRDDEFRMALTKASKSVSAIIREDHPRALSCFFEVFIHLIQSGLCGVAEKLLKYVGPLYGVMGRPALGCVYQLLGEVKAELLSEAMAIAWSSLAVSIRLDYIKRVHWLEDYAEEERLLRQLRKQLDRTRHPSVPRVLLNLAHNMNKQRRYDDAKNFARNVLELTEKHGEYANKLVERIEAQKVIAKSYYAEGSMAKAELSQRRLIEMVESTVGRQHAWFAEFLNVLEIWLRSWGKETEADTVRREVIGLIDEHQ